MGSRIVFRDQNLSEDENLEGLTVPARFRVRDGLTVSEERVSAHGV